VKTHKKQKKIYRIKQKIDVKANMCLNYFGLYNAGLI